MEYVMGEWEKVKLAKCRDLPDECKKCIMQP